MGRVSRCICPDIKQGESDRSLCVPERVFSAGWCYGRGAISVTLMFSARVHKMRIPSAFDFSRCWLGEPLVVIIKVRGPLPKFCRGRARAGLLCST